MFISNLKKTFEDTKALYRFIYENIPFFEDSSTVDLKNYMTLQIPVLTNIANLKFGGELQKFMTSDFGKLAMKYYREFIDRNFPNLIQSKTNPDFNPKDNLIIGKATEYVLGKLYPVAKTMTARG